MVMNKIEQYVKDNIEQMKEYADTGLVGSNPVRMFIKDLSEMVQPEIEVGKWYVDNDGDLIFVEKIKRTKFDGTRLDGYGFIKGDWMPCRFPDISVLDRPATYSEVQEALRKEWTKRCKGAGIDDPDNAKIEAHADGEMGLLNDDDFSVTYNDYDGWGAWNRNGLIFKGGEWAIPKPPEVEDYISTATSDTIEKEADLSDILAELKKINDNLEYLISKDR